MSIAADAEMLAEVLDAIAGANKLALEMAEEDPALGHVLRTMVGALSLTGQGVQHLFSLAEEYRATLGDPQKLHAYLGQHWEPEKLDWLKTALK